MIANIAISKVPILGGCRMVKLSISLPNSTQITLESDEPDVINQVLGMLLHGSTTGGALAVASPAVPANGHGGAGEKGTDVTPEEPPGTPQSVSESHAQPSDGLPREVVSQRQSPALAINVTPTAPALPANEPDDRLMLEAQSPAALEDFTVFCQSANPMGDMRRVVVAAEGASRFFNTDGVNAEELGELFDLAGWRRANSFTQTLRNSARTKFGWLERVPGRSGRYAPTDRGRSETLGSAGF